MTFIIARGGWRRRDPFGYNDDHLHVTHENIKEFDGYAAKPNQLAQAIRSAHERQQAPSA